ncbi:retrovirus-related pol polyprotein from transposon TNT 1-94 [Tanacetum coccineum]
MVAYTFAAVEEEDTHEPLTYQEGVSCEESSKWKDVMEEDMDSMRKNKTFGHTSIRVILIFTASRDYELEQHDVKTTFLHRNLEEVIYMRQPPGYEQDDMLIACKSKTEIGSTKSLLKKEFDMKELREAKKILGMEINRQWEIGLDAIGGHFKLSWKDRPFRNCDVERMRKVSYANADCLMYLMVCTRLDIAYTVSVVSRYLANPSKNHWEAVK